MFTEIKYWVASCLEEEWVVLEVFLPDSFPWKLSAAQESSISGNVVNFTTLPKS